MSYTNALTNWKVYATKMVYVSIKHFFVNFVKKKIVKKKKHHTRGMCSAFWKMVSDFISETDGSDLPFQALVRSMAYYLGRRASVVTWTVEVAEHDPASVLVQQASGGQIRNRYRDPRQRLFACNHCWSPKDPILLLHIFPDRPQRSD